jgi:hypothetical protein
MNTDSTWWFVSLAIGAAGMGFFLYGKKQSRWPQLACGILLSVYPYFVSNIWVMLGIAVVLIVAVGVLVRLGH